MSFDSSQRSVFRPQRRVLNTGSGPVENQRLHRCFHTGEWREVRLDIDPAVRPDLVGSVEDMRAIIPDASFDAIWSSHSLEHLHSHQVQPALREFRRILKSDGFSMITCPDLERVAAMLLDRGLDAEAYQSPAGPIAVIDMIFGYRPSVALGNTYMCHNTGFTAETLGAALIEAGFHEVRVGQGANIDLWAVATMPQTRLETVAHMLQGTSEAFLISA